MQYGWKLSSPTPPCHRDRVVVVIVVVVVVIVVGVIAIVAVVGVALVVVAMGAEAPRSR